MRICRTISRSVPGDVGAIGRRAALSNSVLSTEYSVLSTLNSSPALQRIGGTRHGSLRSLCALLFLLAVAGCSYGPEKIRTGPKIVPGRPTQNIWNDMNSSSNELERALNDIKDVATAKDTAPKVTAFYDKVRALYLEGSGRKDMTPDQSKQFEDQFGENLERAQTSFKQDMDGLSKRVPALPDELLKAFADGRKSIDDAKEVARQQAALPPPEVLPENPDAPGFSYATFILCLAVLGACVACLFRDGLWSNALRLINVVFAALLAMNFYEPVANYATKWSEDFHSFIALIDFLALWTCFVVFVVVFRAVTDSVSKVRVKFLQVVDRPAGIVLSFCTGWVMVGFTLTSLHLSPLSQYPLLGSFRPNEAQNTMFFGLNPDREWLGFTKYESSGPFARMEDGDHSFPSDFIETQLVRRMHVEKYISNNSDHAIRVNPKMVTDK
jgi:uncharacterized membrane protein required for colicin V production